MKYYHLMRTKVDVIVLLICDNSHRTSTTAKMKETKYLRVFILNKNVLWIHHLIQTLLFSVVLLHCAWHVSTHLVHHRGLPQFILRFSYRLLLTAHNNRHTSMGLSKAYYILTPWSRVRLENLTGSQLVKKFPSFCGTRRLITAFTSARHLSLSYVIPK